MATKTVKPKVAGQPAASLTWEQVAAWRAARHHLTQRAPTDQMLAVAGDICGLQAQVMSSAELALWARVDGLQPGAVQQALWNNRTLVKTWAMRGTLHLLPSAEYPRWQAAFSTYRHYLQGAWFRYYGITHDELLLILDAVGTALDGQQLTREQLAAAVARITSLPHLREKVLTSWGSLLKPVAFRGLLCFAPRAGQNVRFTRPDRWLATDWPTIDAADALAGVVRRFLAAYGPATRDDFGRWWAMPPASAEKLLRGLGDEVVPVAVDGTPAWMLSEHVVAAVNAAPQRAVRLLPAFDPYVLGASRHLRQLLPGPFERQVSRAQGWISPVLLVDGRIEGVWRHETKGNRVQVSIEPFVPQPEWVALTAREEAERLAAFLGGRLELEWKDGTPGAPE